MDRFYNFRPVELVHIGTGPARIVQIAGPILDYIDDAGASLSIDLQECGRIYGVLEMAGLFPPRDEMDWAALADAHPEFPTGDIRRWDCVGLRGALDEPPWFQFLNRRRTQFEFKDRDAFRQELREPLGRAGWNSWDAC